MSNIVLFCCNFDSAIVFVLYEHYRLLFEPMLVCLVETKAQNVVPLWVSCDNAKEILRNGCTSFATPDFRSYLGHMHY